MCNVIFYQCFIRYEREINKKYLKNMAHESIIMKYILNFEGFNLIKLDAKIYSQISFTHTWFVYLSMIEFCILTLGKDDDADSYENS